MRHSLGFLILLSLVLASNCFAVVMEALPHYAITPTLNGLNIAYFVTQDKVKITLYAVNHEHFPVLCDAEYQGGPDNEKTREQTVMPEKAIAFTFSYPKKTDNVLVQFMCVKPGKTSSETSSPADDKSSATETPGVAPIVETDLSITH